MTIDRLTLKASEAEEKEARSIRTSGSSQLLSSKKSRKEVLADGLIAMARKGNVCWAMNATPFDQMPRHDIAGEHSIGFACAVVDGYVIILQQYPWGTDGYANTAFRYTLVVCKNDRILFQYTDLFGPASYNDWAQRLPIMELFDIVVAGKPRPIRREREP